MYSFFNLEPVCCSMFSSNCCFLTYIQISEERGQMVWYSHLLKNFPQFVVIYTVKGFGVVNKADVFMELSCFFYDPMDVENLITGPSAISKSSLNIWKVSVHVLLKTSMEDFQYDLANMWNECNCVAVWLALAFFGFGMKTDLSQSCGHSLVLQICLYIEFSILTASSSRIWNSSNGIPSLSLFFHSDPS